MAISDSTARLVFGAGCIAAILAGGAPMFAVVVSVGIVWGAVSVAYLVLRKIF